MKARHLFALFVALVTAGCATSSSHTLSRKMGGLSLGMSRQQVAQILGTPTQSANGRVYDGPTVTYPGFSEVHQYLEVRRGATNDYILVFNKDKLAEYGSYVGDHRARHDVFKP